MPVTKIVDRDDIRYINELNQLHRLDGPAYINSYGEESWYVHDRLHRVDGPAVIHQNGIEEWRLFGLFHRLNGPAYITSLYNYYLRLGEYHRLDGPAIECKTNPNFNQFWIDGHKYNYYYDYLEAVEQWHTK